MKIINLMYKRFKRIACITRKILRDLNTVEEKCENLLKRFIPSLNDLMLKISYEKKNTAKSNRKIFFEVAQNPLIHGVDEI